MFCFLCGLSVAWFRSLWSYIVCNCFFFCRNLRGRKRNLLPIILWEEMSCWMTAHKKKNKKNSASSYNFSALHLVLDPQEFAENLFRPLVPCNIIEGFSYSVQSFGQFMFYYHVFFKVVIFVFCFSHWSQFDSFQEGAWGRRRSLELTRWCGHSFNCWHSSSTRLRTALDESKLASLKIPHEVVKAGLSKVLSCYHYLNKSWKLFETCLLRL